MRIRKQASKLLGWAYNFSAPFPYCSSSSPPMPPAARYCWPPLPPPEADPGELQCQLNLSPWDAVEYDDCTNSQEELMESSYCEEEMQVFGDVLEAKEEPITEAMVSEEVAADDVEENKEEDGRTRKKREAQKEVGVGVMKCKKTDGKGWHCKRDAQPPHSLCSYHLAQLRSYRARYDEEASEDGPGRANARRKKTTAASGSTAGGNYYYYYSVLGPWWSKRRGSAHGEEDLSKESSESHESFDTPAVEDDGYQEAHTRSGVDDHCVEEKGGDCCEVKKRNKRPIKKRGRKPVKARSLKSLL
ncbi:hypothetical protein HPP92_025226 [Vanilla planifolia]|uniref:WRC domain-containing protein n=1 Tax=Vanilla planifolia TaxID=51239 RepID=A0A835UA03_VANPL|nr:hypothetical protein HPP92_025226 [Vanilla planifolia]